VRSPEHGLEPAEPAPRGGAAHRAYAEPLHRARYELSVAVLAYEYGNAFCPEIGVGHHEELTMPEGEYYVAAVTEKLPAWPVVHILDAHGEADEPYGQGGKRRAEGAGRGLEYLFHSL